VEAAARSRCTGFDRHAMQRLLALPGDLRLDVCGDDFGCENEHR
jgi:hypothetical protein